jgi:hypothetical protein
VEGGWRRLHNEELHNFYSSLNIIRKMKSRRTKMGGTCSTYGIENRKGRDHLEDIRVDGRIILEVILTK